MPERGVAAHIEGQQAMPQLQDGGDDVDATHGMLISPALAAQRRGEITLTGGEGLVR
ncbi:hypothetical protein KCP71_16605 [Salmonella enterica subsp. enterica]|nr:hypothetical protein KCP71_16605 [Salmonella enterica subsp. enterica]